MDKVFTDNLDVNHKKWKSIVINTAKMVLILLITLLITELLQSLQIGNQNTIMVYALSVLVISWATPSYTYGIIAALISSFAYDFLITEPRLNLSFTIGSPITLITMMVVTLLTSTITMQMKTQARLAFEREHRAQIIYEINQKLLAAWDVDTIISLANEYLISHLKRSVIFYVKDPTLFEQGAYRETAYSGETTEVFHRISEQKQVHRIFKYGASIAERLFDNIVYEVYYAPLVSKGNVLGVVGIACQGKDLSPNNLAFLQMLIGQFTFALEIRYLSDEQNHILLESEKEKMRSTLLHAISHDLRTPLTSILGAGSAIIEQRELPRETLQSLAKDICENTQWLIRMVENLLTITRISGDHLKMVKTPEAAEEVIAQSVSIVRKRFPKCNIHVHTPNELLIVPMDATLISQVLINLLENAMKNSPEGSLILLNLEKVGAFAQFEVSDNGKGIPQHLMDNLFEAHSPKEDQTIDAMRGMGIGLSICQTIVKAHGGFIEGHNRKIGGASFTVMLPVEEDESLG